MRMAYLVLLKKNFVTILCNICYCLYYCGVYVNCKSVSVFKVYLVIIYIEGHVYVKKIQWVL